MKRAWITGVIVAAPGLISGGEPEVCSGGLTIREYNLARLPDSELRTAHREAQRLFRDVGVVIRWDIGDPKDYAVRVFDQSAANPRYPEPAHPESINTEIVSGRYRWIPEGMLGISFPFSRQGIQVMIFSDRIRLSPALNSATLMGYVMAHEIAHVLLQSTHHSQTGIMQANWNRWRYERIVTGGFVFSKADAASLRAAANHRRELACPTLYSKYPDE